MSKHELIITHAVEYPETVFPVDRDGLQAQFKDAGKLPNTTYWQNKQREIGFLILIPTLILIIILAGETDIFNYFWKPAIDFVIGGLFRLIGLGA